MGQEGYSYETEVGWSSEVKQQQSPPFTIGVEKGEALVASQCRSGARYCEGDTCASSCSGAGPLPDKAA